MKSVLRHGRIACAMLAIVSSAAAFGATGPGSRSARSLVTQKIDNNNRVTLAHNVRPELNAKTDLGPVEDALPIARMFMVLKRTPENQAAMANLIERQHQATAPEFHKWLTPQQVGERFGSSQADIAKVTGWLSAQGFTVNSVKHNNSIIDFSGTAGMVRAGFHTQLHYVNINGEKRIANAQDPQVPAALAPVVSGIVDLENIPPHANHTAVHRVAYDKDTHKWHDRTDVAQPGRARAEFLDGGGDYAVAPQDFYTIYNENPLFTAGHMGANATIAVIEETAIAYGTVDASTGAATGGDVAAYRTLFGVPGTLNMTVDYGAGTTTCTTPAVVPGEEVEATLDAEWSTTVAPSANLIFMTCGDDNTLQGGIFASMTALIDNNLADSMSLSYGSSEIGFPTSEYQFFDMLASTAASQGQSIFISSGDSGSDVADQDTGGTAIYGINVSAFADGPYITSSGGTDFQDAYDQLEGGLAQSTYWGGVNSADLGDALSYVPETAWNDSCASSIVSAFEGTDPVTFCGSSAASADNLVAGDVVGGSGGFSTNYTVPSYQSGITGYSGAMRAQPDIAMFASNGFWGHYLVFCDSDAEVGADCSTSSLIAGAGGTSFVAPQMAGLGGLLTDYTGSRQGVLNYALYALAKAQFTNAATATACYSNGQTGNTGVSTGVLPAAGCIFNDVTTSNNDVPCASGSMDCYSGGGTFGILSTTGSGSLTTAYNSGIGYDEVSGIGSINISNLLTEWNTAFTSTTTLAAAPASITTSQDSTLTATVAGGTPAGYTGETPALAGQVNFFVGSTNVGSCTLAGGACNGAVSGAVLGDGSYNVTATFVGSNAYPTSTSTAAALTVTGGAPTPSITATPATVPVTSAGASGMTTLIIAGFSSAPTSITCTGLPRGASCSPTLGSATSSTLTISTTKASLTPQQLAATNHQRPGGHGPMLLAFCLPGFLALAGMAGVRRKTILSRTLFMLALSVGLAAGITGCGSSGSGTPAGSSTVTITATAGSQSATTTITLTVN